MSRESREPAHVLFEEFVRHPEALFARVVQERRAVVVEREDGSQVLLRPVSSGAAARRRRRQTAADLEAFLASAGGWQGLVDTEQLKAHVAASRRLPSRPPVEL